MKKRLFLALFVLVLIVFGCQKKEVKKVVVASKPMSEQFVLAHMISILIEHFTDIEVELKLGIGGGTSNIHPAMIKGEIDIYPEYSGTGWLFVLKKDLIKDPSRLFAENKRTYQDDFDIFWFEQYGFNNTFTLALKESIAQDKNIKTYSDLAQASDEFVFGAEYDFFERDDGFKSLSETYGFSFAKTTELDIGLKYRAIGEDQVDVINAFSTDGLLKEYNLTILVDDKNFFPSYQAATLVRGETLKKYPELKTVLKKLEGQISDIEMMEMNYKVDNQKKEPAEIAREFLQNKGIL